MKEIRVLLAPAFWSVKNSVKRFDSAFYRKVFLYAGSCGIFLFLVTKLLNIGMTRLHSLSPEVFNVLLIKGYSLVFVIIFFMQIVNGFVISLNTCYQSRELEVLFTSPVDRTALFFSRFLETHMRASWMLIIFGIPLLISSGLLYRADILYYVYALAAFAAFSVIPVNIGMSATIVAASFFSARRLKKFLLSAGIVAIVLLVTLLRVTRPERFVNPELFANLTLFVTELNTPSFILLPNRWLSEALFGFLRNTFDSDTLIVFSLLFLTAYVTTLFLQGIFVRYHYRGWGLLQEGGILLREKGRRVHRHRSFATWITERPALRRLVRIGDERSAALIRKDLLVHVRDPRSIHQILILASLIIVYLFSIASLPLNWEGYAVQLKYVISFFNLGLILVIIAALCSRIVYPAVVADSASLWIVQASPITPKRYVRTKFLFLLLPVLLAGQLLAAASSLLIGIERFLIMLTCITVGLTSFSLVGMAVISGVSGFRRTVNDGAQEEKTSSPAHMIASVFLILFTLVLEGVPAFLYFLKEVTKAELTQKAWLGIGAVIAVLFLLNLFVTGLSMRFSVKAFERLQAEGR
jgi:ABC-2 type transport system permease protein